MLTVVEVRSAERAAAAAGCGMWNLMRRAGEAVAAAVAAVTGPAEVLVLAGPGNNGGDGLVAAATLRALGWSVRVAAAGPPVADPARRAVALWDGGLEAPDAASPAPVLIDALFGTGITRPVGEPHAAALGRLAAAARTVIAIDLPSGVEADSGAPMGAVPRADLTVVLGALKPAHGLEPAASRCGRVVVADIGLDTRAARLFALGAPRTPRLAADAHKYRRGHALVLAGPAWRGGAARLAAAGAARAGAGLVTILAPPDAPEHAARLDAVMVRALGRPEALAELVAERRAAVLALGPGLGPGPEARAIAEASLALALPLVLDADIFTLFAGAPERLRRPFPTVITPHDGEFARLMGDVPGPRYARARAAAEATGAVVVLKGPDSVIAAPDGAAFIHHAPAPALATAGSGDVLTGLIAGRIAAGDDALTAAAVAVSAHGAAGLRARFGLTADELPALAAAVLDERMA